MFRLVAIGLSLLLGGVGVATHDPLIWDFELSSPGPRDEAPIFETVFDYKVETGAAHAPSIRLLGDRTDILWFEGTRESHEDVVIRHVPLTRSGNDAGWAPGGAATLFDRHTLAARTDPHQAIWSLGNTVQTRPGSDAVLTTVVSIGGWAMAAIARVEMEEDRVTRVDKLRLSPMLNRSHLVRGPTVGYADGSLGLPAYFEMGNAFGVLVRLDEDGIVRDRRRITQGRFAIQPEVVVLGPREAVALLRNFDRETDRLVAAWTTDGGQTWTDPTLLDVPNPGSPVAAVRLRDGDLLMVYNDDPVHSRTLSLARSSDKGRTWRRIRTLDVDASAVRYPALARLADGNLLLTYSTGSKTGIRAHVFNDAWVAAQ